MPRRSTRPEDIVDQITDHAPETPNLNPPRSFQVKFMVYFYAILALIVIFVLYVFLKR